MATVNSCDFGTGTAGQVLTSNGAGVAPTFQAAAGGGVTSLTGTANQITASASTGAVTLSITTNPTLPGTTTISNNLNLPLTTASNAAGVVNCNSVPWIRQQPSSVGADAVFIGNNAGNITPTGGSSVNIGDVCIGTSAGIYNDSSGAQNTNNVAIGYQAMMGANSNRNKTRNVVVGAGALAGDINNAQENVIIGWNAAGALTVRPYRTVSIGSEAQGGANNDNQNNNILIGWRAGYAYTAGESDNIIIGYNRGTAGDANTIRIGADGSGSGQQTSCFIGGIAGVTVSSSATVLINTSTGQLGTVASSARFKENITDMADRSNDVLKLRPVTFTFKNMKPEKIKIDFDPADPFLTEEQKELLEKAENQKHSFINSQEDPHAIHYGLIAEEVAEILPDLVVYDDEKQPFSVKYQDLPVLLLNEIKKLIKRIEVLESK